MLRFVYIAFFCLFAICSSNNSFAKGPYLMKVTDNAGSRSSNITYLIRNDSLIINALTDFGRTRVDYYREALPSKEVKKFRKLLKRWTLKGELILINEANIDNSGSDMAPREFRCMFEYKKRKSSLRVFNCYFMELSDVISFINAFAPEEVRIDYKRESFKTDC